jgi:hypothetical protein
MVSIDIFKTIVLTLESAIQKSQILYINSRSASVRLMRQFHVLIRRRNRPGQSDSKNGIRPGQSDSEKRDSARTVGFGNQAASAREIPEESGSDRTDSSAF